MRMRVSQVIRHFMREAGASYLIYTNKYKHTRTVKCYTSDIDIGSPEALKTAIKAALPDIPGLKIRTHYRPSRSWGLAPTSFIVSYPVDIVDCPVYLQK